MITKLLYPILNVIRNRQIFRFTKENLLNSKHTSLELQNEAVPENNNPTTTSLKFQNEHLDGIALQNKKKTTSVSGDFSIQKVTNGNKEDIVIYDESSKDLLLKNSSFVADDALITKKYFVNNQFKGDNYYNKTEVDTELAKKADKATTYNKTEVDVELAKKADQTTTYNKTEVDTELAKKADKATTYNKTEVDTKYTELKTYADDVDTGLKTYVDNIHCRKHFRLSSGHTFFGGMKQGEALPFDLEHYSDDSNNFIMLGNLTSSSDLTSNFVKGIVQLKGGYKYELRGFIRLEPYNRPTSQIMFQYVNSYDFNKASPSWRQVRLGYPGNMSNSTTNIVSHTNSEAYGFIASSNDIRVKLTTNNSYNKDEAALSFSLERSKYQFCWMEVKVVGKI